MSKRGVTFLGRGMRIPEFSIRFSLGLLFVQERTFLEKAARNVGCAPLVFAVNKWDLVEEEERERVSKNMF